MSFLVEDDQQATLELALAFIDACDEPTITTSSSGSSSSSGDGSPDSEQLSRASSDVSDDVYVAPPTESAKQEPSQQKQRSKKAKSNANAVTRHRERKKAETISLRSELIELEAKLAQLQKHGRFTGTSALQYLLEQQQQQQSMAVATNPGKPGQTAIRPKQVSIWLDIAAVQARDRYQAESLNTKLKDALERQMKVARTLESILGKKTSLFGTDLLRDDQQQALYNDSVITQQAMVFEDLRTELQEMYITADFLFDPHNWSAPFNSVSSSTQVKQDLLTGSSYVEVCTTTPLLGLFQEVGQVHWDQITLVRQDPPNGKYRLQKRFLSDTSFQKSYTMVIDGPDGPLELRGASYVMRFIESNRMLCMWHSRLLTPNDGPRFVEKGWVVTSSPSSLDCMNSNIVGDQPQTVHRTSYQVSCDSRGARSAHDPHTSDMIELVMRTLSNRTRDHHQHSQNALSDHFALAPIQRQTRLLVGSCF